MSKDDVTTTSLDWGLISLQLAETQRLQLKQYRLEQEVDSTNEVALNQFCRGDDLPAVCFSESQARGRGRKGRNWISPESKNIYMSLAWDFKQNIEVLHSLSLAVGVVVADLLTSYGVGVSLKWPNDVQVKSKKLAGVLLESTIKPSGQVNLVIGIGLNVGMQDSDAAIIDQPWTDLCREMGATNVPNRNKIAGDLLCAIMQLCSTYETTGFIPYRLKWNQYDVCMGAEVQVQDDEIIYYGTYMGINEKGALRVLINGDEQVFYAADVSLRVNKDAVN